MGYPLRFIQISDSHLGNDRGSLQHGLNTFERSKAVLDFLPKLGITPTFIVHTGDFVSKAFPNSYPIARALFEQIKVPFYFTVGNHDNRNELLQALQLGPHRALTDFSQNVCYSFEFEKENFLVLDGLGPADIFPGGLLSARQMEILDSFLAKASGKVTVFLHFPLLSLDSPWVDSSMLLQNGTEAHRVLRKHKEKLRAVFYGHVHHPLTQFVDGVLYIAAGSMAFDFETLPMNSKADVAILARPSFNLVTISEDSLVAKVFTV